jgi:hypothetical protein
MIISHKYKFIFLKTSKTAGTSMEIALSKYCGPEDIITPISDDDETIRMELGHRTAQNFVIPYVHYSLMNWIDALYRGRRLQFYNHISAREVKRMIGDKRWNEYFKFCFERNPWDRFISLYYWRCKQEPRPSIAQFMASGAMDLMKQKGFDIYSIDGKLSVDKVYRYEDLKEALKDIRIRLGLPEPLSLPKAKGEYRLDRRPYREVLSAEEKDRIAQRFSEEISLFGYSF